MSQQGIRNHIRGEDRNKRIKSYVQAYQDDNKLSRELLNPHMNDSVDFLWLPLPLHPETVQQNSTTTEDSSLLMVHINIHLIFSISLFSIYHTVCPSKSTI